MGSSGSGRQIASQTLRYAPYIESKHSTALEASVAMRKSLINDSPYDSYIAPSADDAFFSIGFMLSSYPSLYDTFGRFMAGVDIDSLFSNDFSERMANTDDVIESELSIVNDSVDQMQKEKLSLRNLNATNSSTFVIAQANIEKNKIKETTKLRLAIKYSLLPGVVKTWEKTLSWDKSLVTKYAESLRDYYLCRINADDFGYKMNSNNVLWPITVLDFERGMLGAMTSAKFSKVMTERERSNISKVLLVLSYVVTGAQVGSNFYPPVGTIIGAIIGLIIGIAVMLLE